MTLPSTRIVDEDRIRRLNDKDAADGDRVVYWMQQSQRAEDNHALEYAVRQANDRGQGLLVVFGLTDDYPEANLRHYRFMLEGLQEVQRSLERRKIRMVVRRGRPDRVALTAGAQASVIVCDRGYLRHQKRWRSRVALEAACPVVQVESDVVVPVAAASGKAEYAARTLRPKIHAKLERFRVGLYPTAVKHSSLRWREEGLDLSDLDAVCDGLRVDRSVGPVSGFFTGGTRRAKAMFSAFLRDRLARYAANSNQPQTDDVSRMSPYLHFGQISPLYLSRKVSELGAESGESEDAYLEELIVRRELAVNFVHYRDDYDRYDTIPDWARRTLDEHRRDRREHRYDAKRLEAAETHDPYWNAAMREMRHTGFMHNYMRMYWGKKILEWSESPEEAFETTLMLNNRYFLDGRDPNSYAGVAWIYGLHDRAWSEREIFGKVRYMAASGLERKCDIQGYVKKVEKLCERQAS